MQRRSEMEDAIKNEEVLFQSDYPQNRGRCAFFIILHIFLMMLFVSVPITQVENIYLKIGFGALMIYVFGQQIYFEVMALKVKEFFILKEKLRINFFNSSIDVPLEEVYYKLFRPRDPIIGDGRILRFYQIKNKIKKFLFEISFDDLGKIKIEKILTQLSSISGRERCDFTEQNYVRILQGKFQVFPLLKKSIKE